MKTATFIISRRLFPLLIFSIILAPGNDSEAQGVKESTQDLSKAAQKGALTSAQMKEDGSIVVSYTMKVDKKSDQLSFEDYMFDRELNFKGTQPGKENKETKPDKKGSSIWAYAGGSNSFNVNSQKLSIEKIEGNFSWNYKRQRYELDRRISSDKVKLKNAEGRYDGYVAFSFEEGAFIIGSYDPGKDAKEQFVALFVDKYLNVKETAVTTGGNYSLVYCGIRVSGNPFVIMAPKNKMPDLRQYVYAEFTGNAELVKRSTFNSPSPNMMLMDYSEVNGELYLIGASVKGNDPYEEELTDFSTIENPAMGISRQAQKYSDAVFKKDMDNFHLLKLKDGELVFAGTTAVKSFEEKVVAPPGQKKKHAYEGKSLYIASLTVTPAGEYFITGQLMDKDFNLKSKEMLLKYKDIVGFYFGSKGELKAQYAVDKMNDDTKSEVFPCEQNFILCPDGKSICWEILEVKGTKGYASYWDAVSDTKTFYANYFPRIAKINLSSGALSEFTVMGNGGKYLVYKKHARLMDEKSNTIYYFGHDDDYEKLWVGKFEIK